MFARAGRIVFIMNLIVAVLSGMWYKYQNYLRAICDINIKSKKYQKNR